MADNIAAKSDASTTLGTLAADDIGGILYVRNKLIHGADGVNAGDVSSANPLPTVDSTGNTSLASIDGKITAVDTGAVVVSSSALPSGASTAAKQPALGTAGTASSDVISVQGIASMTPLQIGDNSGSLTVDAPVGTPVFVRLSDGSSAIATLPVSLASVPSHAVTNAGTFAVQSDGSVAHDSADSGSPVKVGAKASTSLAGLTLVANADRTDLYAGIDGALIVRPHCGLEDITSGVAAITDGSSTSVIAAQGAGVKTYVTSVIIANTSATAVTVDIRDGAAGTVKATFPVPASTSGVVCNLPVPLAFSANTAVCADPSAAASTVTVTLCGFKSKV